MGQYWVAVNLDKKEFVYPHKLGVGLKLGEQIGSGHGTPDALFILTAAMRERRGGGDFDWDTNYYGHDRFTSGAKEANLRGGKVDKSYNAVAKRTVGRWAGDSIAIVGDYSEDRDLPSFPEFSKVYGWCRDKGEEGEGEPWTDVTDDVARVIEHEVGGRFVGDGWR